MIYYIAQTVSEPQRAFAPRMKASYRDVTAWISGAIEVPPIVMLAAEHPADCEATRLEREERIGWRYEQLAREDQ